MTPRPSVISGARRERGAILVHVAISILVLMALSSFVIDMGVLWLARAQAQNAADGGALAGAVALAFDESSEPPEAGGAAFQSADKTAKATLVYGETPGVVVSWECPSYVTGSRCARVDVYRDGTNGSTTLPAYFAWLLGVTSQKIKATATARATPSNAAECLRPWAVPDQWQELSAPPETFDRYYMNGPNRGQLLPSPQDVYVAPTESDPGTGYSVPEDLGALVTLKFGNPSGSDPIQPGWYLPVDIPRADGSIPPGGDAYRENIASCNGIAVQIGEYLRLEQGAKIGPTIQGVNALIAQDPNASWNPTTNSVDGSCAPSPACGPQSPRIVALPIFDVDNFQYSQSTNEWAYCGAVGNKCVRVTNILGFFVVGVQGNNVVGYLMKYAGVKISTGWQIGESSAFGWTINLVR